MFFNRKKIEEQVNSLEWYHTIDLGRGILTPGHYDHRQYLDNYGLPEDLKGKKVLDIGAASGFFSFEMEKRGAEVTATDLQSWMDHDFGPNYTPDRPIEELERYLHEPFDLAKRVLKSKVNKIEINIHDISSDRLGTFDLVFCSSVLLHITDPIKALWCIYNVTQDMAIIETSLYKDDSRESRALFYGHHGGTTWWLPNRACLESMVQNAGFDSFKWQSEFRLDYRDGRPGNDCGVIHAWKTS